MGLTEKGIETALKGHWNIIAGLLKRVKILEDERVKILEEEVELLRDKSHMHSNNFNQSRRSRRSRKRSRVSRRRRRSRSRRRR